MSNEPRPSEHVSSSTEKSTVDTLKPPFGDSQNQIENNLNPLTYEPQSNRDFQAEVLDAIDKESTGETVESAAQKDRGLLHVPSRQSSQKGIQPSPTSTGLSGATVSGPAESIERPSRESKPSFTGRRRNGSAASSNRSLTSPGTMISQAGHLGPSEAKGTFGTRRIKKRSSFLSFLNCCGIPDDANSTEDTRLPTKKINNVDSLARPTTSSKPGAAPVPAPLPAPIREKEVAGPSSAKVAAESSQQTAPEAAAPQEPDSASLSNPAASEASGGNPPPPTVSVETPSDPINPNDTATPGQQLEEEGEKEAVVIKMPGESRARPGMALPLPEIGSAAVDTQILPPPPPPRAEVENNQENRRNTTADPVEDKQQWLLPPIAPRFKGKKCLVLDLDETLVHSSFKILHQADFTIPVDIEGQFHNVYVIKRPGVDQFMKRVGELYEVVVFTASVSKYGDPLLDQLDIHNVVHHRLFRDSCYNHQGNYVKDLSQVGRDLRETIIIDNSPTSYIFHPQHAVPISSWFSDAHDNELLDLIPVLEDLAGSQVRDVSLVLDVAL